MKRRKKQKLAILAMLVVLVIPTIAFAYQYQSCTGNYQLKALKTGAMTFEVTNSAWVNQNNNVTVTKLLHDAGGSTCHFCKLDIVGQKKGLIFYSDIGKNTINTPTTGYYYGKNYGNVGIGKFKYKITNNGAFENDGTFKVNAQP